MQLPLEVQSPSNDSHGPASLRKLPIFSGLTLVENGVEYQTEAGRIELLAGRFGTGKLHTGVNANGFLAIIFA